jgi:hypothetical protein
MTRRRRPQLPHATGLAGMPDTAMSLAFLRALLRLVERTNFNPDAQIALPTGLGSAGEVLVILKNLQLTGAAGGKVRR